MKPKDFIPKIKDPYKSILIFGPPGSGKGTVGRILSQAANHFHLSSGEIFRGLSPDSPAGKLYHQYASKGHLVPDEVTIEIWHHFVEGLIETNRYNPAKQYLLLDGIPRTLQQADLIQKYIQVKHIIVLDMPNTTRLIERLQRRARIENRMDDMKENVLKNRMQVYEQNTAQLINHYPKDLISVFNADQKPLHVLKDILIKLSDLLSIYHS